MSPLILDARLFILLAAYVYKHKITQSLITTDNDTSKTSTESIWILGVGDNFDAPPIYDAESETTVYDAQNRPLGTSNFVTLTNVTQITRFFQKPSE